MMRFFENLRNYDSFFDQLQVISLRESDAYDLIEWLSIILETLE